MNVYSLRHELSFSHKYISQIADKISMQALPNTALSVISILLDMHC